MVVVVGIRIILFTLSFPHPLTYPSTLPGSSLRSLSHSKNRQLYSTGLSDFLSKHVLGDKESFSSFTPTFKRKSEAATLAMKMAMDHFMFESTHSIVRQMFIQELEEEKFKENETVCHQGDPGDKLYVVESGTINFYINDILVGEQCSGGVFGELSLVYGIERRWVREGRGGEGGCCA